MIETAATLFVIERIIGYTVVTITVVIFAHMCYKDLKVINARRKKKRVEK